MSALNHPGNRGAGISLLVPFRPDDEGRARTWDWLSRYWQWSLPAAEILIGSDDGMPFSKACAVNEAAARATGNVFVIMDADCYMDSNVIVQAADHIRSHKSWWVPYNTLFRIRRPPSDELLALPPEAPIRLKLPPAPELIQGGFGDGSARLHGAVIMVVPAAGFWEVGGMDPRFRGWGSEDTAFSIALDTLWVKRNYDMNHHVAHLWHARIGEGGGNRVRRNVGQKRPMSGHELARRYWYNNGKPRTMRKLVDEGFRAVV